MKQGLHFIADCYTGEKGVEVLASEDTLRSILVRLVGLLNMEILFGPEFCRTPLDTERLSQVDDSGGITGFVVVTTSHLAFHTWPLERRLSLDVYSCRNFDPEAVQEFLAKEFYVDRWIRTEIVDRSVPV